jgi:hypothetical protein
MQTSSILLPLAMFFGLATAGINSAVYEGTGCPPGSVGTAIAGNSLIVTFIGDDYRIYADGPRSLDCKITISYTVPSGWSSSSLIGDYRGYAQVSSGGRVVLTSPGGGFTINGPATEDYTHRETTTVNGASGSTQTVVLNTAFALSGTLGDADAGYLDSIDLSFVQKS